MKEYVILVEWDFNGTTYRYAKDRSITVDGDLYSNRIISISGIGALYMDRSYADFPSLSVTFDNLADDGSRNFPFIALNEIDDFEDSTVRVYLYDAIADLKVIKWFGIMLRPKFNPSDFTVSMDATFAWDAAEVTIPRVKLGHRCSARFGGSDYETLNQTVPSVACTYNGVTIGVPGFTSCGKNLDDCTARGMTKDFLGFTHIAPVQKDERNNLVDREKIREGVVPLVYGAGDFKIRPEIFRAVIIEQEMVVLGLISGCHPGAPFDLAQLDASRLKFGHVTRASWAKFWIGEDDQEIPRNRTIYPSPVGHSRIAYFAARFPLTKEQIDKYSDNVGFHFTTAKLDGGRKTLRFPTDPNVENPVWILEDILRDQVFGLGIPAADFDVPFLTSTASYVGGRFSGRFEIDSAEPLTDFVQRMCATYGLFVAWVGGKLRIGAKRHNDTSVATFGGPGGYKLIDNEEVTTTEKDFRDIVNEISVKYRSKMRRRREFAYVDAGAQIKAGNGIVKSVPEEIFLEGIYDDSEAAIATAIWLREEQNANLYAQFRTPLEDWEDSGVEVGDVITIISDHILDNATNQDFRVYNWDLDPDTFEVTVDCQIYLPAVYDYNADPIDGDLIRDGGENNVATRPPDVENVTADIADVFTDDDSEAYAKVTCAWDYPDLTANMAEDNAEGIYPEYPIEAVTTYWRYTDESINDLKFGARVQYPTAECQLIVPFHKNRELEVWYVAIGKNNGQGALGYIIDPNQTTSLDGTINSTVATFDVDDAATFDVGEYIRCEQELMKVSGVAGDTVTVENIAAVRTPQLDTTATNHEDGTEIGVAAKSHPTALADMTVRRHTLPPVTGVTQRSRPRGVRVKWDNNANYDTEKYFLYWSVTGALDNADVWVTGWTGVDPKSPTAGINLVKTGKKAHHLIPQEDIDAAYGGDASGVDVQVRIAMKIKNNYSSALSALPGSSPGHHNKPWEPPADPVAGDIDQGPVDTSDRVPIKFTLWATSDKDTDPPTPRTFAEVNTHIVGFVLEKYDKGLADWSGEFVPLSEEVEDPDSSFQILERTFHKGSRWRIRKAFARNPGTGRNASALVNIEFRAGEKTDDLTAVGATLAIAAFGSDELVNSIEHDSGGSQILVSFTQDATPAVLRELQVRKKKDDAGVTKWRRVPAVQLLDRLDDDGASFNATGLHKVRVDVNHPADTDMLFSVRLMGADGDVTGWVQIGHGTAAGGGDMPIRSDANGPNYPSGPGNAAFETTGTAAALHRNHVIADGAKLQVEAAFQLLMDGTANDQTFDTPDATYGPVRDAVIVLQKRNAANSANEGDPLRFKVGIDGTKGSSGAPFYAALRLEAGAIYDWPETIFSNSSYELKRSSTPADTRFRAGRGSHQFDATQIITATLTRTDSTNNRNALLDLVFDQPATPVLLKRAVLEVTYNRSNVSPTWKKVKSENLLDDYGYVSATGGVTRTIPFQCQHKKNQNDMGFRVILVPVNSTYSAGSASPNKAVTTGVLTASEDAEFNSVAPPGSLIPTPTIKWTRKGLRIRVARPNPAIDGFMGTLKYGWVISSSAGPTFITIDGASTASQATAEFFTDNNHFTLNIRRRDLSAAVIAAGLTVNVRVFSMVNGVETASDTSGITVGGVDGYSATSAATGALEKDAYNDDDGITVRRQHHANQNLIEGGACLNGRGPTQYNAGSGTDVQMGRNWRVGSAANAFTTNHIDNIAQTSGTGVSGNPTPNFLTTTAKFGISWDRTNHRIQFTVSGSRVAAVVGRNIHAGRFLAFSLLIGTANAAFSLDDFAVHFVSLKNSTTAAGNDGKVEVIVLNNPSLAIVSGAMALPQVSPSVAYKFIGGVFRIPSGWTPTAAYTGAIVFTPTWTGAATVYLDDLALYHGRSIRGFQPGAIEKDLDYVTTPSSTGPHLVTGNDTGILNEGLADYTIGAFEL